MDNPQPHFRYYPEGRHSTGELRYIGGLPVLSVGGSPEQIGAAVGALALRPAPRMAAYPEDMLRLFRCGWLALALRRLGEGMVERFDPDYRAEFEAVVRASDVERGRMVMGNTLFDLKKLVACSGFGLEGPRSVTGSPVLGRNLDYPDGGYAHHYTMVTVCRPAGKLAFASVGFPGLVGVLSGMNEAGLAVAVLEVFQAPLRVRRLDPWGTPYALCLREVLETCSTIDEAYGLLSRKRRTTLYNVALADRQRVAAFEVTPARVFERRSRDGVCVCTNHFHGATLQPAFALNWMDTFGRDRKLNWVARQKGRFDVADVHRAMHLASAWDTLQTMAFEPESLQLHLAFGAIPASAGPLATLGLAPLLRGEALRGAA
ncbi:MAG: C45 family peptidase [Gemmataceae bacterium]